MKIDAVIMAAGKSERMGENKLLLPYKSTTIIEEFLKNFPYYLFENIVFVYSDSKIRKIAENFKLILIKNNTKLKSNTIKLAQKIIFNNDATLYLVADQPLLKTNSIEKILYTFKKNPNKIIIPKVKDKTYNPVLFPSFCYKDLMKLNANEGGKTILKIYNNSILYLKFDNENEFTDIDTKDDYEKLLRSNNEFRI